MKKWILSLIAMCFILLPLNASATFEALNKGDNSVIVLHEGVEMEDFIQLMRLTSDPKIRHYKIIIHSPGGNAVTCIAIMNRMLEMQREGVTFTTVTYGAAMSAGTYIFMMGDERIIHEGAYLLFHTIQAQAPAHIWANVDPKIRNMVESWDNYIRRQFQKVTGMSDKSVHYWMDSGESQPMSALTAYNVGVATKYIPN